MGLVGSMLPTVPTVAGATLGILEVTGDTAFLICTFCSGVGAKGPSGEVAN